MFYPKKKITDLDVDEVIEFLDARNDSSRGGFYPHGQSVEKLSEDVTNYGQGRVIENEPISEPVPVSVTSPQTRPRIISQNALEAEYQKRQGLIANGAPKERSLAKRLLQGALRGAATGNIGGVLTGAAVEGFYPKANTTLRTQQQLAESDQNISRLQQQEAFNSQIASQEAARENLKRDDEQRRIEFDEKQKIKQIEMSDKAKRDFTSRVWGKQKYWKSKEANAIDRAELARLGLKPEDIADFDFRDPKVKQIGGVTYQWNAQTQSFDESNLPKDDSKEIVSYDITDADGVKRTFRTTAERAAGLVTSTKNAQMQIEAAAQRQQSQQNWQSGENEKNRQQAMQIAQQRIDIANKNIELAQQRLAQAQEKDKAQAQKDLENAKLAKKRLKVYIQSHQATKDDAGLLEGLDDQ